MAIERSSFYYRARRPDDTPLKMRLRELAAARPRFGCRRLHVLLRREGWFLNHKRTERLYKEEALSVRQKRRRKRISHLRVSPPPPIGRISGGAWTSWRTASPMAGGFES